MRNLSRSPIYLAITSRAGGWEDLSRPLGAPCSLQLEGAAPPFGVAARFFRGLAGS